MRRQRPRAERPSSHCSARRFLQLLEIGLALPFAGLSLARPLIGALVGCLHECDALRRDGVTARLLGCAISRGLRAGGFRRGGDDRGGDGVCPAALALVAGESGKKHANALNGRKVGDDALAGNSRMRPQLAHSRSVTEAWLEGLE